MNLILLKMISHIYSLRRIVIECKITNERHTKKEQRKKKYMKLFFVCLVAVAVNIHNDLDKLKVNLILQGIKKEEKKKQIKKK